MIFFSPVLVFGFLCACFFYLSASPGELLKSRESDVAFDRDADYGDEPAVSRDGVETATKPRTCRNAANTVENVKTALFIENDVDNLRQLTTGEKSKNPTSFTVAAHPLPTPTRSHTVSSNRRRRRLSHGCGSATQLLFYIRNAVVNVIIKTVSRAFATLHFPLGRIIILFSYFSDAGHRWRFRSYRHQNDSLYIVGGEGGITHERKEKDGKRKHDEFSQA